MEELAPCVLLADDFYKVFLTTSNSGDNYRALISFMAWASEKTSEVFIIATSNDVDKLPGEVFRKGRSDKVFF